MTEGKDQPVDNIKREREILQGFPLQFRQHSNKISDQTIVICPRVFALQRRKDPLETVRWCRGVGQHPARDGSHRYCEVYDRLNIALGVPFAVLKKIGVVANKAE